MGKIDNDIELKFDEVYWLLINRNHLEPVILNSQKTKLKLILTGQIIEGKGVGFDFNNQVSYVNPLSEILHSQEEVIKNQLKCDDFSIFLFDDLYYYLHNLDNTISYFDTLKSKIAHDILDDSIDQNRQRYTLKDYSQLNKVLSKFVAKKYAKDKDLEKRIKESRMQSEKIESFKDF